MYRDILGRTILAETLPRVIIAVVEQVFSLRSIVSLLL